MQLISPSFGPLEVSQALQVLSDTNADFVVIGLCSAEGSSSGDSSVTEALAALLSGQPQQAAPPSAAPQLQGLRMHVHRRDRVIVLDASHILSADMLAALLAPERPQPAVGAAAAAAVRAAASRAGSSSTIPVEGVAALLGLQLLVFLMAVCNVVVVGAPEYDLHLLQLLEACSCIASSIPDLTTPPAAAQAAQQAVPAAGLAALATGQRHASGSAEIGRRGRGQQQQQQQRQRRQQQQRPGGDHLSSRSNKRRQQQQLWRVLPHHLADLVLLQSCCMQLTAQHALQLQQLVDACLAGTAWARRQQQLECLASVPGAAAATAAASGKDHQQRQCQQQQGQGSSVKHGRAAGSVVTGVNVWLAPVLSSSSGGCTVPTTAGKLTPQQEVQQRQQHMPPQLQQLANKLLALPRTVTAVASSVGSDSCSGCFSRPLSERDWLRGAERAWEAVQSSSDLLHYYSLAAAARYTGAGGWRQR